MAHESIQLKKAILVYGTFELWPNFPDLKSPYLFELHLTLFWNKGVGMYATCFLFNTIILFYFLILKYFLLDN